MKQAGRFVNRELSWLEFNQRVVEEACDSSVPLLERLNFLSIAASNLDEFFMVRVGGLKLMTEAGITDPDPAGMRPAEQLVAINARVRKMMDDIAQCYRGQLAPAMAAQGLRAVNVRELTPAQHAELDVFFKNQIFPAITPVAVHPDRPLPLLTSLALYLLAVLPPAPRKRTPRYAFIPSVRPLGRFVPVPGGRESGAFLLIEDVIATFVGTFFPGQRVLECIPFRTTRNADIHVDESFAIDLAHAMRKVIRRRKTSGCVRLEIATGASDDAVGFFKQTLNIAADDIFTAGAPLMMNDFRAICTRDGFDHLRYAPWLPQQHPQIDPAKKMFTQISAGDLLVSLPYERFDPVARLVEEAAEDPDVLAIKQILYRTNAGSPIIEALRRAAINGKSVTVLVELKARFDEANNIEWAERLEHSGVQVIYGIKELKTHAKICMIVRRETEGIVRYLHFGTGNYNSQTATLYTDVGLFTRNDDLGVDASAFFNAVCGCSEPQPYLKLVQAPIDLRERLIELIDAETAQCEQGHTARIIAKMNALVDPEVIEALYRASQAGVDIQLIVRGTCCLRPGVPGLSENIRVTGIVDRFLEHSRIFFFYHGGTRQVFIASADWMPRNLSRRIELMIPVEDRKCAKKLIRILNLCVGDVHKGWIMQPDGSYARDPAGQSQATRAQALLYRDACRAVQDLRLARRTKFEPHLPTLTPGA